MGLLLLYSEAEKAAFPYLSASALVYQKVKELELHLCNMWEAQNKLFYKK